MMNNTNEFVVTGVNSHFFFIQNRQTGKNENRTYIIFFLINYTIIPLIYLRFCYSSLNIWQFVTLSSAKSLDELRERALI